jgi:hypothetical protein
MQNFELDDFNILDMTAKKVLEALYEFGQGEFVRGEQLHKKTGLPPEDLNKLLENWRNRCLLTTQIFLKSRLRVNSTQFK